MNPDETCCDCGATSSHGLIFHKEYCCDVYIISAPFPQNEKQRAVDSHLTEHLVIPLENQGFKCFLGSRNIIAGEYVIEAMTRPLRFIPLTVVPVFKDRYFTDLCRWALRAEYFKKMVFLSFESSTIYFPAISTICINDRYLLKKIVEVIQQNNEKFPIEERRRRFELGIENDSESTVSSSAFCRQPIPFSRSDRFRASIHGRLPEFPSHSEVPCNRPSGLRMVFPERTSEITTTSEGIILLDDIKRLTSPENLLYYCLHQDEKISKFAAQVLTRIIQKDTKKFLQHPNLQIFETKVRMKIIVEYSKNCEMNNEFEKLYFWILASAYLKIFKTKDASLKAHVKQSGLKNNEYSKKPFDHLFQKTYHTLSVSVLERIQSWPKSLSPNEQHIKKLDEYFTLLDDGVLVKDHLVKKMKNLTNLPRDLQHIFVVLITEKIFGKKFEDSHISLYTDICALVGKKYVAIFLPVVDRATEYILQNCTKGNLDAALKLLQIILEKLKTINGNDKLMIIVDHYFKKLVYHISIDVRKFVTPFVFREHLKKSNIAQLGSACIPVDVKLVEECIREKISNSYPDLTLGEQMNTGPNVLVFMAQNPCTSAGLLYMLKQETLNDILQTNLTDNAYESFQDMSRAVKICQGNDNIITLQNIPSSSSLPFYVVEHGVQLLEFLHEKENQLTISQMSDILLDITKAVDHCHNNYVILRDITPASFVIVARVNGSFQVKLASFQYAKCTITEEVERHAQEYIEDINLLCFQGDANEPVSAYFSAPETLNSRIFSKYTEAWMIGATFYSVLLYGRQPFQELAHLAISDFVKEITSSHSAVMPSSFPPDLWPIVNCCLESNPDNRKSIDQIIEILNTYKANLGDRCESIYSIESICPCINPEDIQKGYLNNKGDFKLEQKENSPPKKYKDYVEKRETNSIYQTVASRMNLNIRKKLTALNHPRILGIVEILNEPYTTTLVSCPLDGYTLTLDKLHSNMEISCLLNYLQQLASAVKELHLKKIVHCDLRCSHVYVDPNQQLLKLGHLGKAVYLKGQQIFKMMAPDAEKWSAPEVKTNGMYSFASDIFALAAVFLEAISTQKAICTRYRIKPFSEYSNLVELHSTFANTRREQGDSTNELLKCMQQCWNPNPTKRPSVDKIVQDIMELCDNNEPFRTARENVTCVDNDEEDSLYSSEEGVYENILEYIPRLVVHNN